MSIKAVITLCRSRRSTPLQHFRCSLTFSAALV